MYLCEQVAADADGFYFGYLHGAASGGFQKGRSSALARDQIITRYGRRAKGRLFHKRKGIARAGGFLRLQEWRRGGDRRGYAGVFLKGGYFAGEDERAHADDGDDGGAPEYDVVHAAHQVGGEPEAERDRRQGDENERDALGGEKPGDAVAYYAGGLDEQEVERQGAAHGVPGPVLGEYVQRHDGAADSERVQRDGHQERHGQTRQQAAGYPGPDVECHHQGEDDCERGDGYLQKPGVGVLEDEDAQRNTRQARERPGADFSEGEFVAVLGDYHYEQRQRNAVHDDYDRLRLQDEQQDGDGGHPNAEPNCGEDRGPDEQGRGGHDGLEEGGQLSAIRRDCRDEAGA